MRYLVVGALALLGIVVGSFFALNWALHATMSLAWVAAGFAALGVLVLIGCLVSAVLTDGDSGPEPPRRVFGPPPSMPRDRAQERAWLRDPYTIPPVRPVAPGPSAPGPNGRETRVPERRMRLPQGPDTGRATR